MLFILTQKCDLKIKFKKIKKKIKKIKKNK